MSRHRDALADSLAVLGALALAAGIASLLVLAERTREARRRWGR